jgi:trimeric autotransporter adhesin
LCQRPTLAIQWFNTAEGQKALFSLATGSANTAVGWYSLWADAEGSFDTATGAGALLFNTSNNNTAFGAVALLFNTTGTDNTAVGFNTLVCNNADKNTAIGADALSGNTTGEENTATGTFTLPSNTEGSDNTANGFAALISNITDANTAIGARALFANTANGNTAVGDHALFNNTTGTNNAAVGLSALANATSGGENTALGPGAGATQSTGSGNVYIGTGVPGVAGENGACYISSIFGQTSAAGTQVFINASNKLGTSTSYFKENIKPMDKASETLFSLKPVTFRYKKEIDPAGMSQCGLVAEEVEKVNPDLIVRDKEGKPYSVRYDQVNAMLLNEFLKEHKKVEELEGAVASLAATVKEQAAQIQKVSADLDASRPAPQVVSNNQ